MSEYDFLIVGAGFAGSVVARQLHDKGKKILVVDRRDHVAGNAYDELCDGVLCHRYGPHIFNAGANEAVEFLSRFTEWRPYEHRVLAQSRCGLVPMPINRTTLERFFELELPTDAHAEQLLDLKRTKFDRPTENVEEEVLGQVGPELYEEFFRPYTEKQWGRPAVDLDRSVVARLPVRFDRDDRYFTSKFQAMPRDGYTAMFDRMLDGIDVQVRMEAKDAPGAGHTVWTGPVDEAFDFCFGPLSWRSLLFKRKIVPGWELRQPVAVVNFPAAEVPWTRITEYRHITGQNAPSTVLDVEFPSAYGDPFYPVPSRESRELYRRYAEFADADRRRTFVGRLATYKYLSMHQVVGQALRAAERLA